MGEPMGEPRVETKLGAPKWENQSVRSHLFGGLGQASFFLGLDPTAPLTASVVWGIMN